jgi:hypothetical protein
MRPQSVLYSPEMQKDFQPDTGKTFAIGRFKFFNQRISALHRLDYSRKK